MDKDNKEVFRDSIATIDKSGKRNFIFPKKPKGKLYNYRTIVSWFLLGFLLAAPFIKIKGNQFLLFNILERKFHIFGFPFWPQDFHLLVISMLVSVVFVILFTVVFGRIFCGWVCPQTIFMEMVFRKVEYLIEGDRSKQIKLDKQEWNAEKIRKRVFKWFMFFIISFVISNVFLAYIIGSDKVLSYITDGPLEHLSTLAYLLAFTGVFYFVFAWFREQVCIIVCPYGRLQGVLLDNKSINVAYDYVRGEGTSGRKKLRKDENRDELGHGDCIDCKQCVQVCPTGIDIRNGTQLECINCTACIDACDAIMDRSGFDKGLIRYASEDNIDKKEKFKFNARLIAYSTILTILIGVLITMLFLRNDIEATILRLPGQTFQSTETTIKNVYTVKLINKTTEDLENLDLKLISHPGKIDLIGGKINLVKQGLKEGTLFIEIDKKDLNSSKEKLKVGVYSNGKLIESTTTNFTGPLIIK
ncbi:cytochrome c oxidase accessory protein CcoG [Lutibacter sp. A64]|uniref:cytochrome c oxidase accessory protein CcoG n=1 Tax=Lutibacter sp. A64 TaxID=2918526 RepID=UPI001F053DDD|nr:cytochrome c oxidase accessory protein CcoG [Lutibacter sp. A64]UMB54802.1 cytochrome c oxidase accessory protein CcoG [Lutibacter sp. A64]